MIQDTNNLMLRTITTESVVNINLLDEGKRIMSVVQVNDGGKQAPTVLREQSLHEPNL